MDNAVYRHVYNLHQERLEALDNGEPDFWTHTAEKVCKLAEDHDNDDFCCNLLAAVWWDLEGHDNPTVPEVRRQSRLGLMRLVIDWAMEGDRYAASKL